MPRLRNRKGIGMDRKKKIIELIVYIILFISTVGYCIYLSVVKPKDDDTADIVIPKEILLEIETEAPAEINYEIDIYQPMATEGVTWDVQED